VVLLLLRRAITESFRLLALTHQSYLTVLCSHLSRLYWKARTDVPTCELRTFPLSILRKTRKRARGFDRCSDKLPPSCLGIGGQYRTMCCETSHLLCLQVNSRSIIWPGWRRRGETEESAMGTHGETSAPSESFKCRNTNSSPPSSQLHEVGNRVGCNDVAIRRSVTVAGSGTRFAWIRVNQTGMNFACDLME
jgi:hypothetical protein